LRAWRCATLLLLLLLVRFLMELFSRLPPFGSFPVSYSADHKPLTAFLASSGGFHQSRLAELQSPLHRLPVDVREKCLNIGRPFCRRVVEEIRVFPHIHDEDWNKSRHMPMFVKT